MLIKEAKWLGEAVQKLDLKKDSVFLNFGSQSEAYNKGNNHILEFLIDPIKEKYIIKNLDMKPGKGIEFVGNIYESAFFKELKKGKYDCILLCNLLEHVTQIDLLCNRVNELLQENGIIIFSGPYDYPKHCDPIDNGFRPTVEEVASLFPDYRVIKYEIVTDYTYSYYVTANFKTFIITILRTVLPFYRFRKWKEVVIPMFLYWSRKFKVTCVILQKNNQLNLT